MVKHKRIDYMNRTRREREREWKQKRSQGTGTSQMPTNSRLLYWKLHKRSWTTVNLDHYTECSLEQSALYPPLHHHQSASSSNLQYSTFQPLYSSSRTCVHFCILDINYSAEQTVISLFTCNLTFRSHIATLSGCHLGITNISPPALLQCSIVFFETERERKESEYQEIK